MTTIHLEALVSTEQFAKINHVKRGTVHRRHSLEKNYHGVFPLKHPSGRLFWPAVIANGESIYARDALSR